VIPIYSVDTQVAARAVAEAPTRQMHFIAAGLSDPEQPLDRCVSGAVKSSARKMFLRRAVIERGARLEKPEAVQIPSRPEAGSEPMFLCPWKRYSNRPRFRGMIIAVSPSPSFARVRSRDPVEKKSHGLRNTCSLPDNHPSSAAISANPPFRGFPSPAKPRHCAPLDRVERPDASGLRGSLTSTDD
jgi:hypothetical protein